MKNLMDDQINAALEEQDYVENAFADWWQKNQKKSYQDPERLAAHDAWIAAYKWQRHSGTETKIN